MNFQINCPRNYVGPNPNLTYHQNVFITFNDYINASFLQGSVITNVVPLDGNVIPICSWLVFFTYVPAVQRGSFKRIKLLLDQNKPRNAVLRSLRMLGVNNYCVEYSVICDCKALDFNLADETCNKVNSTAFDNLIKDVEKFHQSIITSSVNINMPEKVTECGFLKVLQCDDMCEMAHLIIEWSIGERGIFADVRDEYDGSCATKLELTSHINRIFSGPNTVTAFGGEMKIK